MSQNCKHNNWQLNIIAYMGMLSVGMIIGSLGPILVPISDFFQLRVAQVSYPVVFNSMGFFLAGFVVSFTWRVQRAPFLLTLSSFFFVVSLLSFIFLHINISVILTLLFLVGLCQGLLHASLDSLFCEIYKEKRVKYLNILHVFFTIGAFLGPVLVGIILAYTKKWYLFYFSMGLLTLPLPIFFWRKGLYKGITLYKKTKSPQHWSLKEPAGSALFWTIVLAMFAYVGVESSITSWTPLFLNRIRDISAVTASYSMSIFWFAMIGGRLLFGRLLQDRDLSGSLVLGASGAVFFTILTLWSKQITLIALSLACAGLLLSFSYPGLIALGGQFFSKYVGFVIGVLAASGSIGYIFFPWFVGQISEALGLSRGVFVTPLFGVSLASILICFRYLARKNT